MHSIPNTKIETILDYWFVRGLTSCTNIAPFEWVETYGRDIGSVYNPHSINAHRRIGRTTSMLLTAFQNALINNDSIAILVRDNAECHRVKLHIHSGISNVVNLLNNDNEVYNKTLYQKLTSLDKQLNVMTAVAPRMGQRYEMMFYEMSSIRSVPSNHSFPDVFETDYGTIILANKKPYIAKKSIFDIKYIKEKQFIKQFGTVGITVGIPSHHASNSYTVYKEAHLKYPNLQSDIPSWGINNQLNKIATWRSKCQPAK